MKRNCNIFHFLARRLYFKHFTIDLGIVNRSKTDAIKADCNIEVHDYYPQGELTVLIDFLFCKLLSFLQDIDGIKTVFYFDFEKNYQR